MASRTTLHSGTGGAVTGDNYMDNVKGHTETFYKAIFLRVTSIAGTANDPTGTIDPALDAGLIAGMGFWFEPISNNNDAMTLKIGSESAVALVGADGTALVTGDVLTTTAYLLFYDGTELRIVSTAGADTTGSALTYTVITGNGTLTKPTAFPDDGLVIVEAWGGGGGGNSGAGGGGGAFNRQIFRGADLGTTETVTIGTGGASSTAGGNTSVGTLVLAFGGGKGGAKGGGGGGQLSAGGSGDGSATGGSPFGGAAGAASAGGHGNAGGGGDNAAGGDGINGGGGGSDQSGSGGDSLFGGGGGGSSGSTSVYGGDGGGSGVAGTIPAGGGGKSSAVGARGEVRVRWIG